MSRNMKLKLAKTAHTSACIIFRVKGEGPALVDFPGERDTLTIRYKDNRASIYCGLGEEGSVNPAIVRKAAGQAVRKALQLKHGDVSLVIPVKGEWRERFWKPALEGAILGAYSFTKYKNEKGTSLASVELVAEAATSAEAQHTLFLCESVNFARDLVNDNAHDIYPESFAREARAIARKGRMECIVLDEKAIKRNGMGLLLAVGQGIPPAL
jgi:leucyl aminopeptidase